MRALTAILLCLVGLSASTSAIRTTTEPLPHDAYVWQRIWTPAVTAAASRSADIIRSWRILLAEGDRSGRWTTVAVPWSDILATGRPVISVIRIDGRLDEDRMVALLDRVVATVSAPNTLQSIAGVEIDYDCPTSKLATYAKFLSALRARLPSSIALSITALPTWLSSSALGNLATDLDEVVLQVHAIDDPRRGLFDPDQAERWVREFGRRISRPFRVALPAYDVRVTWRSNGRLASVEGEVPLLAGQDGEVLDARPEAVLGLLHALQRSAPAGLIGVVWFRLPTEADTRAWSLKTWRAVVTDRLSPAKVSAALVPAEQSDLWNVVLSNEGSVDARLPSQVRLDAACQAADGANGFRLVADRLADQRVLESNGNGRLRAQTKRTIGWARCVQPERQLHVVN
ncbi:DUF3142 domain-containing protein [Reyranella sp.]|uniref:DUF3142 domain-containing protein n=1 Tax=Reyranella sp. TaxID=1929291 RepID=UPI003D11FE87